MIFVFKPSGEYQILEDTVLLGLYERFILDSKADKYARKDKGPKIARWI